jgi:hypothetical protein
MGGAIGIPLIAHLDGIVGYELVGIYWNQVGSGGETVLTGVR